MALPKPVHAARHWDMIGMEGLMTPTITAQTLARQIELNEALRAGREHMLDPQDLPVRFGRVIASVDRVLEAIGCEATADRKSVALAIIPCYVIRRCSQR